MQDMSLERFEAWIVDDAATVRQRAGAQDSAPEEIAYAQVAKLGEEAGELCEQVLGHFGYQRAGKDGRFSEIEMAHEVADVVITAWELVEMLGGQLSAPLASWTDVASPTLRDVEAGTRRGSGIHVPSERRLALRAVTRLQEDAGRLSASVADHFAYERQDAHGPALRASEVVVSAFELAFRLGLDPVRAMLEKRDIILARCFRGDA